MRHPELAIQPEHRGVAFQPARLAVQGLAYDPAFAQAVAADQDEEVQMAASEGLNDLLQLGVGGEARRQRRCFHA